MEKNPNPYIEIDRDFQFDPLLLNPKYSKSLRLYLWLRLNTAHKTENVRGEVIEKGQLIRSYDQMAVGIRLSKKEVRDSIDFLVEHGYIIKESRGVKKALKITVLRDAGHNLGHRFFDTESIENTWKNDSQYTEKGHSLGHSYDGDNREELSDNENTEKKGTVLGHRFDSAETVENTGKTDIQQDEKGHSVRAPYENNILYKENGIKDNDWTAENVDNSAESPKLSTSDPEKNVSTADPVLTAEELREYVIQCELSRDEQAVFFREAIGETRSRVNALVAQIIEGREKKGIDTQL